MSCPRYQHVEVYYDEHLKVYTTGCFSDERPSP